MFRLLQMFLYGMKLFKFMFMFQIEDPTHIVSCDPSKLVPVTFEGFRNDPAGWLGSGFAIRISEGRRTFPTKAGTDPGGHFCF